ncbi:acyltransferase [Enterococcus hulanensis]|uniref:acyltransferase family protein n=1 Tax=Enterococcus hulanensis TaxID=2559929 RepID=UPI001A90D07B|nr:acyltransferase [Enterococcus hulanensis]MBO0410172.1 acyltransferase [Enterococcus hulanensis]
MQKRLDNFKMVDIIKYLSAFLVICIHCNPIVKDPHLNYFIKQFICRTAVPFFFVSSAFFVRRGMQYKPAYLKHYLKNLGKSYIIWSIVFIPIGVDWINQNLRLSHNMLPLALVFGLIHVGTYYHLWYIPALLLSLLGVAKALNYFSYKTLLFISTLLYLFGSLETYYGYMSKGWLKTFFDLIIQIFFTTRSGFLFGMVFVVIGFIIYDYQEQLQKFLEYVPAFTIYSAFLLIGEVVCLYHVEKLDMNFLLMLLPFTFFAFLWSISHSHDIRFDTKKIRDLSKYYYFIHPVCIVIIEEIGKAFRAPLISSGMISFVLICMFTHIVSSVIIQIQKRDFQINCLLKTLILGLIPTFLIASLIYSFKGMSIVLKFELVPSIYLITSISIYHITQSRNYKLNEKKGG